ncbi:hypothetical protein DXG01_010800 [Tephrocybe rancida]|nr:hypothetical protein DXG01_010800 [Tephrocybe rancida]
MSIAHGIRTLGVLGAGQMGTGIALVAALRAKVPVLLHDRSPDQIKKGLSLMDKLLAKDVSKGRITSEQSKEARDRVTIVGGDVGVKGLRDVDMVVEAVSESLPLKQTIFASFAAELRPDAILATNTSSISITKIAASAIPEGTSAASNAGKQSAGRVVGILDMKLVELISALQTTPDTLERARAFAVACGKEVTVSKDVPGFVSNALLIPFINEAIMCLEKGTATREDIDTTLKLGMNHPMGPLQLADFIGLDTCLAIQQTLYEGTRDSKYRPSILLERMVDAQWYGRKNGKGFYEYDILNRITVSSSVEDEFRASVASQSVPQLESSLQRTSLTFDMTSQPAHDLEPLSIGSSASSFMDLDHPRYEERTPLLDSVNRREDGYGSGSSSVTGSDVKTDHSVLAKRIKYYIPSFAWIPSYNTSLIGGDVLAGITVASMLIPQSVSYGTSLAKLNPLAGLFSAAFPAIVYAFLGTSRQLNVAPEAALSLLVGQAISDIRFDTPGDHGASEALGIAVSTIITLQAGLITFLLGFFRLGFIDVVLSRALLRGFISAVAVVIMIEQLIPMLGLIALQKIVKPETTSEKLIFLVENAFTHSNARTTTISFSALAVLLILRNFKNLFKKYWFIYRLPEVLIVVVVSTFISAKLRWDEEGVDILGAVPIATGGSFVQIPLQASNLKYLRRTTSTAVMVSVVGFLDSIVAAKQNAARFGHAISPNRELVALGVANVAGSFIPGTLPAYGSLTRSRINADVGGRTQVSSLVCSSVILLTTFFLLPYLYFLPKCVLASVIILVVFSLILEVPHEVMYYWRMSAWIDLTLMSLTFLLSIIWNVEVGIVVSLIISLLLVVHKSSKARMTILGRIPGTDRWKPVNENPEAEESADGTLIVRIRENLDFERLRRLELYGIQKSHPSEDPRRQQASVLVFHMADVETIDASAAQIMIELLEEYKVRTCFLPDGERALTECQPFQSRGVGLFITHLSPTPRETFAKAGIVDLLGADAFRESVADAIALVERSR